MAMMRVATTDEERAENWALMLLRDRLQLQHECGMRSPYGRLVPCTCRRSINLEQLRSFEIPTRTAVPKSRTSPSHCPAVQEHREKWAFLGVRGCVHNAPDASMLLM